MRVVFSLKGQMLLVVWIIFIFFVSGLVSILVLFASRIVKSYRVKRTTALKAQIQRTLNKIVVNESCSETLTPDPAFEFYMAELRMVTGTSSFARQVLISQILDLKKNVTGTSASVLIKTYNAMRLYIDSRRRLKKTAWQKKALGIRELAEMGHRHSIPLIRKNLKASNETLQQESLMAIVRLGDHPLSFLDDYKDDVSLWMRINIHNYLRKLDNRSLPLFSQWFTHKNYTVVDFAISMTKEFRQTASVPGLVQLVYSTDPRIVRHAVSALGDLEAYQYRQTVADLAVHVWPFEKLSRSVLDCLGRIGDMEKDVTVIGKFLSHPSYVLRFEAVAALRKLGSDGEAFIEKFNKEHVGDIKGIIEHFSEPLLT
jgi:hypothetical protein